MLRATASNAKRKMMHPYSNEHETIPESPAGWRCCGFLLLRPSGVRGLFTLLENIIMVNGEGQMWATVIDDDNVYYYTNSDGHKDTLPRTIEKWRERFAEKPVVYKGVNGEAAH